LDIFLNKHIAILALIFAMDVESAKIEQVALNVCTVKTININLLMEVANAKPITTKT
jgi:hypothetical protein